MIYMIILLNLIIMNIFYYPAEKNNLLRNINKNIFKNIHIYLIIKSK